MTVHSHLPMCDPASAMALIERQRAPASGVRLTYICYSGRTYYPNDYLLIEATGRRRRVLELFADSRAFVYAIVSVEGDAAQWVYLTRLTDSCQRTNQGGRCYVKESR